MIHPNRQGCGSPDGCADCDACAKLLEETAVILEAAGIPLPPEREATGPEEAAGPETPPEDAAESSATAISLPSSRLQWVGRFAAGFTVVMGAWWMVPHNDASTEIPQAAPVSPQTAIVAESDVADDTPAAPMQLLLECLDPDGKIASTHIILENAEEIELPVQEGEGIRLIARQGEFRGIRTGGALRIEGARQGDRGLEYKFRAEKAGMARIRFSEGRLSLHAEPDTNS